MRNLTQVRRDIDDCDSQLIRLLAKRQTLVEEAGWLKPKNDEQAIQASDRVAQILERCRQQAVDVGLSPDVAEAIWRAMIDAFITLERRANNGND
ncbi:chorismate mutase [Streptococcus caballi]|uniref:chorismate mutase n=1 Tax=Streptococcus caballi TaxID=439220 RepID=UPI00036A2DDF|nr:chorismate mutase [Streptococcus caballi]